MSAIAEFEPWLLAQRTREGMATARVRDARRQLEAHTVTCASLVRSLGVACPTLMRSLERV